ncbi:MAG: M20/M25/M40 family metallo-hydrolase [Eubacteriales bacterium]|nr:M20/M25/M40 family metallo-hydrolase [Eubacteriales bacterium]
MDTERIYNDLLDLVRVQGISGTASESLTGERLLALLGEIPYFRDHPDHLYKIPVEGDPLGRFDVAAYLDLDPDSPEVVILTGHYDVVGVEEYGAWSDLAFDAEKLTAELDQLPLSLSEDAQKDLASGNWLFGRGVADMKLGHALALELLRHYDELQVQGSGQGFSAADRGNPSAPLKGNLLYLGVCSEETNSEGMRQAVPFLNRFATERHLHYKAMLLGECFEFEQEELDLGEVMPRYVHWGSSGKVMPMFFFVGQTAHEKEPFASLDPNLLASEVYKRMQLNTDFCQQQAGRTTPPPICLKMQDLKSLYSVSNPLYGAAYYNLVTVNLDPASLWQSLMSLARESFVAALAYRDERAGAYADLLGTDPFITEIQPRVFTYQEIYQAARTAYESNFELASESALESTSESASESALEQVESGQSFAAFLQGKIQAWQDQGLKIQDLAINLVKELYLLQPIQEPMIIVSLIPPYYPDVFPEAEKGEGAQLAQALKLTQAYAREHWQLNLQVKPYYMGICDLCYSGLDDHKDYDQILDNLVGGGEFYKFPLAELKEFKVPGLVLGGFGKDFHKATERLELNYSLKQLPYIYLNLLENLLS